MKLYSFLLLTAFSFLASCDCEPLYLRDGSTFAFRLIDEATGENLFPDHYDPFAFEIIDDSGDTVDIDSRRSGGGSDYGFIIDPTGGQEFSYDQRTQRTYFLQFDNVETDTLELFFIPRRDDCNEPMDNFEAYYNNELVFEGSGESNYRAPSIVKP